MTRPSLVPGYRDGSTVLHRSPPAVKLCGLSVGAVALVATRSGEVGWPALALGAAALAVVVGGHLGVGTPRRQLLVTSRGALIVVAGLAVYQGLTRGWPLGLEVVLDVVALALAGALVSVTTPADRMLDTLAATASPLGRLPGLGRALAPERVALTLALTVRSVDVLWLVAGEARDAARARGRGRDIRALVTPTVIRAVGHARATGDALAARGLADLDDEHGWDGARGHGDEGPGGSEAGSHDHGGGRKGHLRGPNGDA